MGKQELLELKNAVDAKRQEVAGMPLDGSSRVLDAHCEFCGMLLKLARANLEDMSGFSWQNAALARELLTYATPLEEYDHLLDSVYYYSSKMAEIIEEHPRLKCDLLRLQVMVLQRICSLQGREMNLIDYLREDISALDYNISLADKGKFDSIRQDGILKHDPIEWSAAWEENIDAVDKKVYEELADHPRGMGFCFAFWSARRAALAECGIEWRSPSMMNPGVMFD